MKNLLKFSLALILMLTLFGCKKEATIEITAIDGAGNKLANHEVYLFINSTNYENGPGNELSKKTTNSEGVVIFSGLKEANYYAACYFTNQLNQIVRSGGNVEGIGGHSTKLTIKP